VGFYCILYLLTCFNILIQMSSIAILAQASCHILAVPFSGMIYLVESPMYQHHVKDFIEKNKRKSKTVIMQEWHQSQKLNFKKIDDSTSKIKQLKRELKKSNFDLAFVEHVNKLWNED
jgi:septal ring factor EnvC (AmiA/AmiB activator)